MKHTFTTLTALVLMIASLSTQAQETFSVPPLINYQGQLTDENGAGITGAKKLEFNLYDAATGGVRKWGPQTFDNVPVIQGRFNVILGTTDANGISITEAFQRSERYLGIKVTDTGGNLAGIPELTPRQQILSSPYAAVAGKVHFANRNTDWGRIYFESSSDAAHQSNMVFQTFDNNDEGFRFVTTAGANGVTTERARIDDRGLLVNGGWVTPVGAIVAYGGATAPAGWLVCHGQPVPAGSQYNALRGLIGAQVPDLRGMFLRGLNYGRNDGSQDPEGAGRYPGHMQGDQLRSHNHGTTLFHWHHGNGGFDNGGTGQNSNHWNVRETVANAGGSETRPKNIAVNFIIKY